MKLLMAWLQFKHNSTILEEIKKVNEKVYAAQVGCEQCKGPHYTKDYPLKEEAKRHEENSNLIKEIRASIDAAIKNQGASIKTLEIQIGQMSKSILTTVEADMTPIRHIGSSQYAVSVRQMSTRIDDSLPQKEKDPGSFTLPCYINNVCFEIALADLEASVSIMLLSTYLNLGLGELAHTKLTVELADRIVKHPKGIAENVLVRIVVKNMDGYRDQDMRDVIFRRTILKSFMCGSKKDLAGKEIDKVGEVSIIWNPMCVVVMLNSSYLSLRNKYRLSLKNDMPPRDK
ncbi:hypothetical protein Tco_0825779 [Tanacetum coccineum]